MSNNPTTSSSKATLNPYGSLKSIDPKNAKFKYTTTSPFAYEYVTEQMKATRNINADALYISRVKARQISLDTHTARTSRENTEREGKQNVQAKQKATKKAGIIGRKEAALKGLWKLKKEQTRYELFVPLHMLWLGYMSELLALPRRPVVASVRTDLPHSSSIHPKLVKADFHGSIISVKQSRNPCLVGLTGIVIHETENAFRVITRGNQIKLLPKQNSIFTFRIPLYDTRPSETQSQMQATLPPTKAIDLETLPQMEFELYGNQFRFRAPDRANKKFKPKETIEL